MKRNGLVLNKKAVKTGRSMASWAATGMCWADGAHKTVVMAAGRQLLAGGATVLDRLGRAFLAAEAADIANGRAGNRSSGCPASCWWQTPASEIILTAAADN